tara:strand:- start:2137 stop:3174 length:1038 start_codon:yes stop_codon:yes gene_type:complete
VKKLLLLSLLLLFGCNKDDNSSLVEGYQLQINQLNSQLSQYSNQVTQLQSTINSQNSQVSSIPDLESTIDSLNSQITSLQSQVNSISGLEDTIDNLNTQITELLNSIKNLELEIQIVSTQNLVAWYPFNGNADDESGNGFDGQVNNAELTTDRLGNINSAYNFSDYQDIIIPSSADQNLFPITISLWYNASNLKSGETSNLFSKYVSATWNGYQLLLGDFSAVDNAYTTENNGFGVTPWYLADTNNNIISYYTNEPFLQEFIEENIWYHYVFVVDENGGKIYVDGELIDQASWTGTPASVSNNYIWKIGGKYEPGNDHWFNGKIDDIAIWDRALTQQEIKSLYNR